MPFSINYYVRLIKINDAGETQTGLERTDFFNKIIFVFFFIENMLYIYKSINKNCEK